MKNILKYFFNSSNYDSFIIFAILILILIDNSQSIDNQFKKLIKLPNENYFVAKKMVSIFIIQTFLFLK